MARLTNHPARVLIRTLPLTNANYGGILQAYALQQTLRDLELDPATDISVSNELGPALSRFARLALRAFPRQFKYSGKVEGYRQDLEARMLNEELSKIVMPFINERISTVRLYRSMGRIDKRVLGSFDNFLAGSDQVWRRAYGDVASYLFNFVADDSGPIVSYAASFGRDDLSEYDESLLLASRLLAQRFRAVSVRESSALDICRTHWNVEAVQHVDPTLLLSPEHYAGLFSGLPAFSSQAFCLSYVLDESGLTKDVLQRVSDSLGLPETRLLHKPATYREWKSDSADYTMPTVERWLQAFASADFVVTDSFHGTVFSILYNKPFVTVANAGRGRARFDSLLGLLGLGDRLVSSDLDDVDAVISRPIGWAAVNKVIGDERNRGRDYLRDVLASDAVPATQATS